MEITVIKYGYKPASGKQYDVRFASGASQRYVELTRDELQQLHEATGRELRSKPKTRTTLAGTTTYDYTNVELVRAHTAPTLPLSWHASHV